MPPASRAKESAINEVDIPPDTSTGCVPAAAAAVSAFGPVKRMGITWGIASLFFTLVSF